MTLIIRNYIQIELVKEVVLNLLGKNWLRE